MLCVPLSDREWGVCVCGTQWSDRTQWSRDHPSSILRIFSPPANQQRDLTAVCHWSAFDIAEKRGGGREKSPPFPPSQSLAVWTRESIVQRSQCRRWWHTAKKLKGLVERCHSLCLFFIFDNIHTFIHPSLSYYPFIRRHAFARASLHFFIACELNGKNLLVVPSRESNSSLPYSKPTRYQLSHAAT